MISPWNYPFTMALCDGLPGAARRQRRGRQARRPDHAVGAARRPAARGGRLPAPTSGRSSPAPAPRSGRPIVAARRLHLLHRLDRHRPADRAGLRRPADRLLARARRQEPDPGPARRRPREGRRGRRARGVLQRRPAVRLDGADVRRRPGLRPVPRAVRGPHRGDDAGRDPRLGQRHGLADQPGASSRPSPPTSRTPSPRAPGCSPAVAPGPTSAPFFYEPTILEGVTPEMTCFGNETFGPVVSVVPLPRRGRRDRARQRRGVRPQRLDLQPGRLARPRHRPADPVRHGEHQRGVRRDVRQHRRADGRHARVRPRPPPGRARACCASPRRSRSRPSG